MLNRTAEHALRAVIFLARQPDELPVPAETIAAALGAPSNYLAKTLGALAVAGIVRGRRGPRGGYRLVIPADRLTIAEVTDLFEPEHGIAACLLGGRPCDADEPCDAHFRWLAVRDAAREPLRTTTIAEILGAPRPAIDPDRFDILEPEADDSGLLRLLYLP
jgi:Rrf2 family transcriptional regulator, iron-sulfur cluster assembly transcription factor